MKKNILFLSGFMLIVILILIKDLKGSEIKLKADLTVESISNKLMPKWYMDDTGEFVPLPTGTTTHTWSTTFGQKLFLDLGVKPSQALSIDLGAEAVGNYADRFHIPISEEQRMDEKKERFQWISGRVQYKTGILHADVFRAIPRSGWEYEGDMFDLYPAQYDIEGYRRVSGACVPQGGEVNLKMGLNNLSVTAGPELTWGMSPAVLVKYAIRSTPFDINIFYKDESLSWGDTDADKDEIDEYEQKGTLEKSLWQWQNYEHRQDFAVTAKIDSYDITYQFGLLYQPFRTGWEYKYVEETEAGSGYLGSEYIINSEETTQADAVALKGKITKKNFINLKEVSLGGTYAGICAGNKTEVNLEMQKNVTRVVNFTTGFTYRQPLIGPLPYLYEGTETNPGQTVTSPRGQDSPFWANIHNRKAIIGSVFLVFDPSPGWFYRYEPNVNEEWNLNPKEKASFAFGLGYTLSHFPTTTDLSTYVDENGETVWEPSATYGLWPTDGPISDFSLLAVLNTREKYKFVLSMRTMEALAAGAIAYLNKGVSAVWPESSMKPVTTPFTIGLTMYKESYKANVLYSENNWGPEEWHPTFGMTIDRMYKILLSKSFQHKGALDSNLTAEYIWYRETDNKYIMGLGAFNEIKLMYNLSFGGKFKVN
ncbi:MAG: hypothetical protein JW983_06975 [Elusimicrobia bacterium]|nr:hypothetical protein [Elusimicrobiota bacterium]